LSKADDRSEQDIWRRYESFKNSLPPEMNWREREKALKEYCDKEGI